MTRLAVILFLFAVLTQGYAVQPGIGPEKLLQAGLNIDVTSLASNVESYFVAWTTNSVDGTSTILGRFLDRNGSDRSSDLVLYRGSSAYEPFVSSNGKDYLVVFSGSTPPLGSRDLFGIRVTATGAVLDTTPFKITTLQTFDQTPQIASNGRNYLVTWREGVPDSAQRLRAALVYPDARVVPLDGFEIHTLQKSPSAQFAVASDSQGYMVVWNNGADESVGEIVGVRVTENGSILDSPPILISRIDPFNLPSGSRPAEVTNLFRAQHPAVASNGDHYYVTWTRSTENLEAGMEIAGTAVARDGTVLNPGGRMIAGTLNNGDWYLDYSSVASNGKDFLVAWLYSPYFTGASSDPPDMHGAVVLADFSIGERFVINSNRKSQARPRVVHSQKGEFLILASFNEPFPVEPFTHVVALPQLPFRIHSWNHSENSFNVQWTATKFKTYRVQQSHSLTSSSWFDISGDLVFSESTGSFTAPATGFYPHAFYRVVLKD